LAIVVGIALVAALLVSITQFPMLGFHSRLGFGPNWDCTSIPDSESVCVKKVPVNPPKNGPPAD
jgi:hypothetical protein